MNQPAAVWSSTRIVFDEKIGLTQNVLLTQGSYALIAIIDRIDQLYSLLKASPSKNAAIDPGIGPILSDLCVQTGIAMTTLFYKGSKGRLERDVAYDLRLQRVQYVEKICAEQKFVPETLTNRNLRDSLSYIDVQLPAILTTFPNTGVFIDYVVNKRQEFIIPHGMQIQFFRCYIISENKILHFGGDLDLAKLRSECVAILTIVFGIDKK